MFRSTFMPDQISPQINREASDAGHGLAIEANEAYDAYISLLKRTAASEVGELALKELRIAKRIEYEEQVQKAEDKFKEAGFDGQAKELAESKEALKRQLRDTMLGLVDMFEQYGVKAEDFSLVKSLDRDGKPVMAIVYNREQGLDLGNPAAELDERRSYYGIMGGSSSIFVREIERKKVDSRAGMTELVYENLIKHRKNRGLPLPDTHVTDTLLAGAPIENNMAVGMHTFEGKAVKVWVNQDNDSSRYLFRPAAVVAIDHWLVPYV